jgi:hypothetical protein
MHSLAEQSNLANSPYENRTDAGAQSEKKARNPEWAIAARPSQRL